MQAMELDSPELAKAVAKELLHKGIIINRTHETVLRFLPPYVIQKKHVDQVVQALDAALQTNAETPQHDPTASGRNREEKKAGLGRRKEGYADA
jgi:acetylornithine/succinyldiaminopimelate/putrescine aminotransferase